MSVLQAVATHGISCISYISKRRSTYLPGHLAMRRRCIAVCHWTRMAGMIANRWFQRGQRTINPTSEYTSYVIKFLGLYEYIYII